MHRCSRGSRTTRADLSGAGRRPGCSVRRAVQALRHADDGGVCEGHPNRKDLAVELELLVQVHVRRAGSARASRAERRRAGWQVRERRREEQLHAARAVDPPRHLDACAAAAAERGHAP